MSELIRDWDKQLELANGDRVKAAIGILRCSQRSHTEWRDWLIRNPQNPGPGECEEDVSVAFHQRCIDEYENIIVTIENATTPMAYGLRYTDPKNPYWVGIWNERHIAEDMKARQRDGKEMEIVPLARTSDAPGKDPVHTAP